VEEVLGKPLPDVAAMVREAITAPTYDEHFQELESDELRVFMPPTAEAAWYVGSTPVVG
jgi:hypothetical protein